MIKSKKESRIEIWNTNYITNMERRVNEDKNVDIVQIENTNNSDNFIVEVTDPVNRYTSWIPVTEMLPIQLDLDWVLVRIEFKEGGLGIPHIAEMRDSKIWYCAECKGNMEEALGVKVTHWKPIPDEEVK